MQQLRKAQSAAANAIVSGGPQNFLGANWVPILLRHVPSRFRTAAALRLVSLSPHYFFTRDPRAEDTRSRLQREAIVDQLLAPFLRPDMVVMDYGSGPGYMAAAVARRVRRVEAVDVSRGVLACAQVLNAAPNIIYETPDQARTRTERVDLAYSFAVIQHLTDDVLQSVLVMLRQRVKPHGTLILHFALPTEGWRTEAQWRNDLSVQGRARMRFGLNCFGRGTEHVQELVSDAGFSVIRVEPLADRTDADNAIAAQHWIVAAG